MSTEQRRFDEALLLEIAGGGIVVLLNVTANRLPPHVQLPANLLTSGLAALLAYQAGVEWEEQGLHPRHAAGGVMWGLSAAAVLTTVTAAGLLAPGVNRFYQDERIAHSSGRQMLYEVLVRIPLATALPEELIFRGAFLGLLAKRRPPIVAAAIASLLFGMWHVLPTIDRIRTNPGTRHAHGDRRRTAAVVAGHVATTALLGLGLTWLRFQSKSIVAPIMAHTTPNAIGFLGGWLITHRTELRSAWRRATHRTSASPRESPIPRTNHQQNPLDAKAR